MPEPEDEALREHLIFLLKGGGAHVDVDAAFRGIPPHLRGRKPEGAAHSAWQILEHMRIAQWDILEFSRNPGHVSPDFPDGYWPKTQGPPDEKAWDKSIRRFRADQKAMCALVMAPSSALFVKFPHGQGQTLLREALLVADHNSYHLGGLVAMRRLLGAWESPA